MLIVFLIGNSALRRDRPIRRLKRYAVKHTETPPYNVPQTRFHNGSGATRNFLDGLANHRINFLLRWSRYLHFLVSEGDKWLLDRSFIIICILLMKERNASRKLQFFLERFEATVEKIISISFLGK